MIPKPMTDVEVEYHIAYRALTIRDAVAFGYKPTPSEWSLVQMVAGLAPSAEKAVREWAAKRNS